MNINATEYQEHRVFEELVKYASFYNSLSFSIMGFVSPGTMALLNIDTYTYSSTSGTLESIKDILQKGRINDAYALLRKYHDSIIINIYCNLYLEDHVNLDNLVVRKITDWIQGKEKLPSFQSMLKYIHNSARLKSLNALLDLDNRYIELRKRCNGHMHYNLYYNFLLNDNEIHLENRLSVLDSFRNDLENIFILHFAYLFTLHNHYMTASDYIDSMEMGLTPEEDSQYFVAPFIQNIFDSVIRKKRPDLAEEIKSNTCMHLV